MIAVLKRKKARRESAPSLISYTFTIANWDGEMGHPRRVYCVHRFSELGEIGGVRGLDKTFSIAPRVVQGRYGWEVREFGARSAHPNRRRADAGIVKAATHLNDSKVLLEVREDASSSMKDLALSALDESQMLVSRGETHPFC